MIESLNAIKKLIDECSETDRKVLKHYLTELLPHPLENAWDADADTILSAIDRSSESDKAGNPWHYCRSSFRSGRPTIDWRSWMAPVEFNGDRPYDVLVRKGKSEARIQVKLQRLEIGVPKFYYPRYYGKEGLFVVEVQKTRSGQKSTKTMLPASDAVVETVEAVTVKKTRS